MTRKFKPHLESLEDRFMPAANTASLGLAAAPVAYKTNATVVMSTATVSAPVVSKTDTTIVVLASPQQLKAALTPVPAPTARSLDWLSGLRPNHNETLVRRRRFARR